MYKAIVIGVSMGGMKALMSILTKIPANFIVPIVIVQHLPESKSSTLAEFLDSICDVCVEEASEKKPILHSHVYVAPPGYHLLIEEDFTFSLDEGDYVCYSRPSIDVLFESAAYAYQNNLIALILTGANSDGSKGFVEVKNNHGYTIVQDPATAEAPVMIESAMQAVKVDAVVELDEIADYLIALVASSAKTIAN